MDRFATGLVDREFIEIFARLAVMLRCTVEMGAVALLLDERHDHFERRAYVAHYPKIDRRASADLFGAHIHLCNAHPRAARIELAIWKISAEH